MTNEATALADEISAFIKRMQLISVNEYGARELLSKAETALRASPQPSDVRAHKVMTPEEYTAMPIIGWHEVCRDVDGFGGVGIRFLGETNSVPRPELGTGGPRS